MRYVALLRGINVGGNHKVDMKTLARKTEQLGMTDVSTYLNTGNLFFTDTKHTAAELVDKLESMIEDTFGFHCTVLLKSQKQIDAIVAALPDEWTNDSQMKCDVLFLWDSIDSQELLGQIDSNPDIDTVQYVPGAVLWAIDRSHVTKSKLTKLVGTNLYKQMTIRNCNTTRKIQEKLSQK